MSFLNRSFLFFGLVLFLIASLVQGGLFDKKKDEEEKYTGKDNANIGFKGLQDSCTCATQHAAFVHPRILVWVQGSRARTRIMRDKS